MARIRTIKPKFWDDSKIGKISRDSRLLYIGLWTFSDDVGVVIGDTIWLKSKIFPYDQIQVQQFEKWLSELATNGFICQFSYNNENFIYLPKFARHQVINRPNVDDLNIPKNKLDNILSKFTEQSLINHGTFTEQSVPIKEEEKEDKKESPNGDKKEAKASSSASSNPDFLKFNDWLKRNAPYCSNAKNFSSQITEAEFLKLKEKYTGKQIADIIEQIENRKDLRKRYTNLYRTVLNWAKKEYGN